MVVKATFDTYFIDEYIAPPPPPEPIPTTGGQFTANFNDDWGNPVVATSSNESEWICPTLMNYAVVLKRESAGWSLTINSMRGEEWKFTSTEAIDAKTLHFTGPNPLKVDQTWTWSAS